MNNKKQYSIYPNTQTRIAVHILYWILFFFYDVFEIYAAEPTGVKLFNPISIAVCIDSILIQIAFHYCFFTLIYPLIVKKKWMYASIGFIILYFILFTIAKDILWCFNHTQFKTNVTTKAYDSVYRNYIGFFNFKVFINFSSSFFWKFLPSIIIKLIINFYESRKEKLAIIQERNAMELNTLRSQIQPQFLFDTLNNVYGLVLDNDIASRTVLRLSDLLRFALYDSSKGDITLDEEKEFLTNYILLEKMRHKESRVQIEYNFDNIQNGNTKIKPLILVNFIENAFKHSVNATIAQSWVSITLSETNGNLYFRVMNNKPARTADNTGGVGLQNVRRRLDLEYPAHYELNIKETENMYEAMLSIAL